MARGRKSTAKQPPVAKEPPARKVPKNRKAPPPASAGSARASQKSPPSSVVATRAGHPLPGEISSVTSARSPSLTQTSLSLSARSREGEPTQSPWAALPQVVKTPMRGVTEIIAPPSILPILMRSPDHIDVGDPDPSDDDEAEDFDEPDSNNAPGPLAELEKSAITQFLTQNVFPFLKFVGNKSTSLAFSTKSRTLCYQVMNGVNALENGVGHRVWWDLARRHCNQQFNRMRTDRGQAVKNSFNGESATHDTTQRRV